MPLRHSLKQKRGKHMDKSYRLKLEQRLSENILTAEYVINCIAKFENKINQLAYKEKQYRNVGYNDYKVQLEELIEYRKPYIDFLIRDCNMSLDDIKNAVANVKEKNIPTKNVCEQIRDIIITSVYCIE